jgi:hypothetical protein
MMKIKFDKTNKKTLQYIFVHYCGGMKRRRQMNEFLCLLLSNKATKIFIRLKFIIHNDWIQSINMMQIHRLLTAVFILYSELEFFIISIYFYFIFVDIQVVSSIICYQCTDCPEPFVETYPYVSLANNTNFLAQCTVSFYYWWKKTRMYRRFLYRKQLCIQVMVVVWYQKVRYFSVHLKHCLLMLKYIVVVLIIVT